MRRARLEIGPDSVRITASDATGKDRLLATVRDAVRMCFPKRRKIETGEEYSWRMWGFTADTEEMWCYRLTVQGTFFAADLAEELASRGFTVHSEERDPGKHGMIGGTG